MQQNFVSEELMSDFSKMEFLVGDIDRLCRYSNISAKMPFDDYIIEFLNTLSQNILSNTQAKEYPDVVTLGFWMRKAAISKLKERFYTENADIRVGRGIIFHIAPSNVPVNYAYSLVTGLITGNANIVRIPTKDFPQVKIINEEIKKTLSNFESLKDYIFLVKYDRDQTINNAISSIADVRVIWGGDNTIEEIRKSPIGPRASEITFADRYSLAVIDSDSYISLDNKERFAEKFYNDTFLTDQNACTSPRVVIWTGKMISEAKKDFWNILHKLVKEKYQFQPIMGVNKLTSSYLMAANCKGIKICSHEDNYIIRIELKKIDSSIMEFKDNCGYFFEYECNNLLEIRDICNNTHCQTIGFLGNKQDILPLLTSGIKGVDRVVPIGNTMDFDMIWDGYNLFERLTRLIRIVL